VIFWSSNCVNNLGYKEGTRNNLVLTKSSRNVKHTLAGILQGQLGRPITIRKDNFAWKNHCVENPKISRGKSHATATAGNKCRTKKIKTTTQT